MKRRGRPEKSPEAIGVEAWLVWTFLQERIGAGWKQEAAVQAAIDHFGISRAGVFKHIAMAERVGVLLALLAKDGIDPQEVFAELGLEGLLQRLID